jgi:hypothetical protein
VRALEAKRTDYPSHRQPVPRRLTGEDIAVTGEDTAEYGCRAEEYGIRGNHMPNPERPEIALGTKKGGGISGFIRVRLAYSKSRIGTKHHTQKRAYPPAFLGSGLRVAGPR